MFDQLLLSRLANLWKQTNDDYQKEFSEYLALEKGDGFVLDHVNQVLIETEPGESTLTYEEEQDEAHYRGELSGIEIVAGDFGFTTAQLMEAVKHLG